MKRNRTPYSIHEKSAHVFVCLFVCFFVVLCVCGCCFSSSAKKVRTICSCTLETIEPGAREMTPFGINDKCDHIFYMIIYIYGGWGGGMLASIRHGITASYKIKSV